MADNFAFTPGSGGTGAADDVGGVLYPRVKISVGADGSATDALGGSGPAAAGVLRVVSATDDPIVTAINAGAKDNGPYWTSVCGVSGVAFSSADAQTAAAVTDAPTGGQKLCIDDVIVSVGATAMAVSLIEETSLALMFPILYMTANSTVQLTLRGKRKLLVADKKLMVDASAAGNISVLATYHSEA